MSKKQLTENDTLIINGHEIKDFSNESFNCEFSAGEMIIEYPLNIKVVRGSEADKLLQKITTNKDKYFVEINVKSKEDKVNEWRNKI